jgi:hypothetical protein
MTADKTVHAKYPEHRYIGQSGKGESPPDRHYTGSGETETHTLIKNPVYTKNYYSWLSHTFDI